MIFDKNNFKKNENKFKKFSFYDLKIENVIHIHFETC
jgi:hypothetical protein